MKSPLRKNMGKKNCEFTTEIRNEIIRIFLEMEQSEISKIFNNDDFGYWAVTVERPLRLRVYPERKIPSGVLKDVEMAAFAEAINELEPTVTLDDWKAFEKATKLKVSLLKKVRPYITDRDSNALPIEGEADVELRDTEIVPFTYDGGVQAFIENEVHPYAPDAYVDEKKTQIGYEISFTKYFYKVSELRPMESIIFDLERLEQETNGMLKDVLGGLK